MRARLHLWWQKAAVGFRWLWRKIRQHPFIAIAAFFAIVAFTFVIYKFGWDWTGFDGGYSKITTTSTAHGITAATEQPQTRTLWDWLQLLIVPIMLVIGGFWLNQIQKDREERTTVLRADSEREFAHDNQQEMVLQTYIDKMSELLADFEKHPVAKTVARVRTLTTLSRLDKERRRVVLQFLYEAGLINKQNSIVNLSGAELIGVTYAFTNLQQTDLSRANFKNATLAATNMSGADLKETIFVEANLSQVDFSGADLSGAIFLQAILTFTKFQGANLTFTNFTGANLTFAKFNGLDLVNTFFDDADLTGANFDGANITQEALLSAKSLKDAIMPDGTKHP